MQILGDKADQKLVKPPTPKLQPKKTIQPQTGTVAVLPHTTTKPVKQVKPPPVQKAKPKGVGGHVPAFVPPGAGAQPQQDPFQQLSNALYPQQAPPDAAAIQAPYLDAYNKTLAQLTGAQQTENTFDTKLAGELQTLLSSAGIDPAFAKSLQAALSVESLRNSGNTYAFAQKNLTDQYQGPNGVIAQALSQAQDQYNKSLPSGSDKLAMLKYLDDQQNTKFSQNMSVQKQRWQQAYQTALLSGKSATAAAAVADKNVKNNLAAQRVGIAQQNANTSLKRATAAQTNAAATRARSDRSFQLQWSKAHGFDPVTKKPLPGYAWKNGKVGGTVVKVSTAKAKTGVAATYPNLSKTQVIHLRSGIAQAKSGFTDPKTGKVHPPLTYQQAINEAVKAGYSRADATKMAARFYPNAAKVARQNAKARKGKDQTGLGIQVGP